MSWRDEARADRLARVQADAQRDEAAARIRIAERAAAAAQRREDDLERDGRRDRARSARGQRRAERLAWLSAHAADLLFAPVIGVPAVLAWTAMAAYGRALYGPAGLILPAFSEGGMWVFAAANTITRRRHPERPTWHLMAGTWVFAAAGAALNFAHGLALTGHLAGPLSGAVMALVSAAGVTAHQLVTAGPRRTRADRRQARLDRTAARRQLAVRQAAIRSAGAELDEDGGAWLVFEPGPVTLARRGRLDRPAAPPADPTSDLAALAADVAAGLGALAAELGEPLGVPAAYPAAPGSRRDGEGLGRLAAWLTGQEYAVPAVPEPPAGLNGTGHAALEEFAAEIKARAVPSVRAIRGRLRIGQDKASQVQAYLRTHIESGGTPS
jgi:hypothetical protein